MSFLSRLFPDRKHGLLMSAREIADQALRLAVLSSDTQRIKDARKAMLDATHALMRHEQAVRRG